MDKENNHLSGQYTKLQTAAAYFLSFELKVEPDCTFVTGQRLVVVFCPLGILKRANDNM